jgi:DNA-directed RNA polymerase I subunit RPA2
MKNISTYNAFRRLESLIKIHTDSFNYAFSQGIHFINSEYLSETITYQKNYKIDNFFVTNFFLCKPYFYIENNRRIEIPRQCRELKTTYHGDLLTSLVLNNQEQPRFILKNGEIPIMIKSQRCNLFGIKPIQLVEIDEEELEMGGYFILNGMEKILRLIVVPRKNMIQLISRISNAQRGEFCTVFSCSIRSVDRNQNSKTFHLHYLTIGSIDFRLVIKKQEFFVPVIILIRSLKNLSDSEIFEKLTNYFPKDKSIYRKVISMIKNSYCKFNSSVQKKNLSFLGSIFRFTFPSAEYSDFNIGKFIISKYIFVHLGKHNEKKVELLCFMIQKLLLFQKGHICEDNPDGFDTQEFLLPGNLILMNLKEKLENSKNFFQSNHKKFFKYKNFPQDKKDSHTFVKEIGRSLSRITKGLDKMISTGSYLNKNENDLSQTTGLSLSIERLNFGRFLSYFRGMHRGKYFSEIKSTTGRKIFSESWGFLCPIHTPDGAPCGILNHISASVVVSINNPIDRKKFITFMKRFGKNSIYFKKLNNVVPLILDGEILGFASENFLRWFLDKLRIEKVSINGILSYDSEILYIKRTHEQTNVNHCIIYSQEARPLRLIKWNCLSILSQKNDFRKRNKFNFPINGFIFEIITSYEQNFLFIESFENYNSKFLKRLYSAHGEIDSINILSIIAGITPFSDLNQSPRNMYQCQMFKQSLGIPFYTFWRRNDSKSYFLITPQVPICRGKIFQDGLQLDSFPSGFNAVVSVLTYTGFDMEDAMIINKSSIQRGFSTINLSNSSSLEIENKEYNEKNKNLWIEKFLDKDGLPRVENKIQKGDPMIFTKKILKEGFKKEVSLCFSGHESSIIDQIKLHSRLYKKKVNTQISLKIRCRRKAMVGDKFASRHGQKGVLSFEFSSMNLPFSETGIIPDIVFNPHGFPSRMTIGVIIESIAGKAGALRGNFEDATPFRFFKNKISAYYFGEKLRDCGFQFFGNEILYSGYSGEPFSMDVFVGIVHYQRLKHMSFDKFQISDFGPRNFLSRQPTKGKKSGGAIRLGEMERDALLGHGCSFLLHERIQNSSDLHTYIFESKTGNFLKFKNSELKSKKENDLFRNNLPKKIFLPFVSKFLINELASMNIRVKINNYESI